MRVKTSYITLLLITIGLKLQAQDNANSYFKKAVALQKEKKYTLAVIELEKAAKLNHPDALNELGSCYQLGTGTTIDYGKAYQYYQKASSLENKVADFNLSLLYKTGQGVAIDLKKSFEYTLRAAQANIPEAMINLGMKYYEADGTAKNDSLAFTWMQKAAEANSAEAVYKLGAMHQQGIFVKQDHQKARELYQKALTIDTNHIMAIRSLGLLMIYGMGGSVDEKGAFNMFQKGTNLKDPSAMFLLANVYIKGTGVTKDYKKGFDLLLDASKLGEPDAMYQLGMCYFTGTGTTLDEKEGSKWIRAAANASNQKAKAVVNSNSLRY